MKVDQLDCSLTELSVEFYLKFSIHMINEKELD